MSGLIRLLRPKQWTKNIIIFAGVAFSQRAGLTSDLLKSVEAFVVFCILSGVVYIINDFYDREADRNHPTKRFRPIASGDISPNTGLWMAGILGVTGMAAASLLGRAFTITSASYLLLMMSYSRWLKHVVIIDLFSIAAGFVLRAVAGAVVINVEDTS